MWRQACFRKRRITVVSLHDQGTMRWSLVNGRWIGTTSANANQLAADAVNANFSNLGTNLALRGRYCTTQFGSTRVTAAVGKFADDWALLANGQPPAPTRDAAAAKVDYELTDSLKTFVTAQGYQYGMNGTPSDISPVQLGRAQSVTIGLDFRQGRFALLAEVGGSHRDLGRSYTTLSGFAAPGLKDTYTGAKWRATPWLSLDTDLRRSLNRMATNAVARDAVSLLTSATLAIPPTRRLGFQSAGAAKYRRKCGRKRQRFDELWCRRSLCEQVLADGPGLHAGHVRQRPGFRQRHECGPQL
jgi:hypothetical protein